MPGDVEYWWAVVSVAGTGWIYGPNSFTVADTPSVGGGSGGGGVTAHTASYAPHLPSSAHFSGASVKQTRLSAAAYQLSKFVGHPKTIAVACWSQPDWANISGDKPGRRYETEGLFNGSMPHWLNLAPDICRASETLLYNRPTYPNIHTADAVDTLTHEMLHALGVHNEAQTECYAMQLNWVTANKLGIPLRYSMRLSQLSLGNYATRPRQYQNYSACREGGAWDLLKSQLSLPWHLPQV
jgi:hypothetical protein